ncbi:MAG TPA: phosphoribosylformylglycinamidine synthase subunit PurS [Ktedonobacterales bacterium]|nr:phosphoribosylformylglycinamidine synthase subunit PurS [Ktedonobacterales bacterium]
MSEVEIATADAPATATWLARIHVTLKPVVLDPQGDAVLHGLHQLGYADVSSVRVGKYLEVRLTATSAEAAGEAVRQMCERLLANPVIESYNYEVEGSEPPIASGASASQPA